MTVIKELALSEPFCQFWLVSGLGFCLLGFFFFKI